MKKEEIMSRIKAIKYYYLYDISRSLPAKCKINRSIKKGIIKEKIPKTVIKNKSINECLRFGENNQIIENFFKILETNLSHCNLSSFYKNIETLKIYEREKSTIEKIRELLGMKFTGFYNSPTNSTTIFSNEIIDKIDRINTQNHELLHMASAKFLFPSNFVGFNKRINELEIGRGLNEGYTQIINNKYFAHERYDNGYFQLQTVCKGIEWLIDPIIMEQCYFTNDLETIINELKKFTSEASAINLLIDIDLLYYSGKSSNKSKEKKLAQKIRTDIANIKLNELMELKTNGIIDEDGFINAMFELKLYTLGYFRHYLKNAEGIEFFILESYPHDNCSFLNPKIPVEKYQELARKYYATKKENLKITTDEWYDENKNSLSDIIESMEGFYQSRDKELTCVIFNTAYSELLNHRYLSPTMTNNYNEQHIVRGIELIVGREEMERLYINSDLDSLIEKLNEWASLSEICEILNGFDELRFQEFKTIEEYWKCTCGKFINVANILSAKAKQEFQTGKITKAEYDAERLNIELYKNGFTLEKNNENQYTLVSGSYEQHRISPACLKHATMYFLQNEDLEKIYTSDNYINGETIPIIDYILSLSVIELRDNLDLSQIESIELLSFGEHAQYKINSKSSNKFENHSIQEDVLEMLTPPPITLEQRSRFIISDKSENIEEINSSSDKELSDMLNREQNTAIQNKPSK